MTAERLVDVWAADVERRARHHAAVIAAAHRLTGSYSDYQVECAAGSEADGEQIAATINAFGRSEYDPRCPVQEHRDMAARQHGGRP